MRIHLPGSRTASHSPPMAGRTARTQQVEVKSAIAKTRAAPRQRAKRDPEATRARIVAAAERLFAERGYGDVSMPELAAASGVTAGAIYKHFDSKADLFFEVVRRTVASTSGAPAAISPVVDSVSAAVGRFTARGARRLRQMAVEVHYASAKHPAVRKLLRRVVDEQIADIAAGVAGAQAAGEVDPALGRASC